MPKIVYFPPRLWARSVAIQIQECIDRIIKNKGSCSIMLTGGQSAERVYRKWGQLSTFLEIEGVNFYFGDERCVKVNSPLSNYSMVTKTLFAEKKKGLESIFRIEAENPSSIEAAKKYQNVLPSSIDILLLTVGDDGHIASIFPKSDLFFDQVNRVMPTAISKDLIGRITITPLVITQSENIFVLAPGEKKLKILEALMNTEISNYEVPASLILHGTWFINNKILVH